MLFLMVKPVAFRAPEALGMTAQARPDPRMPQAECTCYRAGRTHGIDPAGVTYVNKTNSNDGVEPFLDPRRQISSLRDSKFVSK